MAPNTGKLYVALIVSVLLSCVAAWLIARLYRRRMQQLMRAPHAEESAAPVAETAPDVPLPLPVSLADNHARWHTADPAADRAVMPDGSRRAPRIWYALRFPDEPLLPRRVAVMALLHLWPMIPALALIWRWSRTRLFGTLLLWGGVFFVVALWRSIEFGRWGC